MSATSDAFHNSLRPLAMVNPANTSGLGISSLPPVPAQLVNQAGIANTILLNTNNATAGNPTVSGLIPSSYPCIARVYFCFSAPGLLYALRYGYITSSSILSVFTALYTTTSASIVANMPAPQVVPSPASVGSSKIVVYPVNSNGNLISGVTVQLLASNQSTLVASQVTTTTQPVSFVVPFGTYYLNPQSSGGNTFSDWTDTGSGTALRQITLSTPLNQDTFVPFSTVEQLNALGGTLVAGAGYSFDIPLDVGETMNFRYSTSCTLIKFSALELDPAIG